jgi:hypothetical protein
MNKRASPRRSPRKSPSKKIGKDIKVHDNGGRPFKVNITPSEIQVYENIDGKYKYFKTWKNYLDVWVGEDSCDKKFSYGNSILVKLTKNKYLFIGMEIVSFTLNKKIVDFYSPVGNNDVPYPWFTDEDHNVYLLVSPTEIEHFHVSDKMLKTFGNCKSSSLCDRNKCNKSDPYNELWSVKSIPQKSISKLPSKVIHPRV